MQSSSVVGGKLGCAHSGAFSTLGAGLVSHLILGYLHFEQGQGEKGKGKAMVLRC